MPWWTSLLAFSGLVVACGSPSPVRETLPPEAVAEDVVFLLGVADAEVRSASSGEPPGGPDGAPVPPPLEVRSERARWDLKAHTVLLEGQVRAVRGDVTLTCDRMDVRYTQVDRIQSVQATGNVVVTRGDRVLEAGRADLEVESGRLELTESPRLLEAGHRLEGRRVVMWLDQDRLECDACSLVFKGEAVAPGTRRTAP